MEISDLSKFPKMGRHNNQSVRDVFDVKLKFITFTSLQHNKLVEASLDKGIVVINVIFSVTSVMMLWLLQVTRQQCLT